MAGSMGIKLPLLLMMVIFTIFLFNTTTSTPIRSYSIHNIPHTTHESSVDDQREFFDFWKNAAKQLKESYPDMFPFEEQELLSKFDSLMTKFRDMGASVETPESFNAVQGLRNANKTLITKDNEHFSQNQGMSRTDRMSPFKVLETAPSASTIRRPFFTGPKPTYSSMSHNFQDEVVNLSSNNFASISTPNGSSLHKTYQQDGDGTEEEVPVEENPSDVQGTLANMGVGQNPYESKSFCRSVFVDDYKVYPQRLKIDVTNIKLGYQDLECERYIERDDMVQILPIVASLLSSDKLRYEVSKLFCSWFYRPLSTPTKLPCTESCISMRTLIQEINAATATPTQLKDRAVLQTFAWPLLLFSGQCEYTPFYDTSNDPAKCIKSDDYTVFKRFEEANLSRPSCEPYPEHGELCSGLLTNYYKDPANIGGAGLMDNAGPLIKSLYALAPMYDPKASAPCLPAFAKQICSRYVLSCTEVPITLTDLEGNMYVIKYVLPQLGHRSVCQSYSASCQGFIGSLASLAASSGASGATLTAALNLLAPNCDAKAPVGAIYECDGKTFTSAYNFYPASKYYSMNLGVSTASIQTNSFTYDSQYDQSKVLPFVPEVTCPAPLVVPDHPTKPGNGRIGNASCATPCPSFLFTHDDYVGSSLMAIIVCTISFVGCLFLIGSYMLFKEIRQGNYFLQFILCLVLITGSFSIGAYSRFSPGEAIQSKYCVDNSTLATQDELPGCAVQAFLIVFSMLAVSAFFASSGFDLFLRIVLSVEIKPHTQQDYLLNLGYYFWGWTIPLLLSTVAAATKSLGPSDLGMFYCFVHGRSNATVPWATAYLPFLAQLFIGCISLSTTIYTLVRVAKRQQAEEFERQVREGGYRAQTAPVLRLGNYIIPIALEALFFAYLAWIVLFRAVAFFLENTWAKNGQEYATCLLVEKPIAEYLYRANPNQGYPPTKDCGLRPKTLAIGAWWFHQVFLACVGIAVYLVLGSQRIYYQLWAAVIGYYFNIPGLLVWAATTQQAKIYAKRVARARKLRQRKLRLLGKTDELLKERQDQDAEILAQVKQQEKLLHAKEQQQIEEKHRKEKEKQDQLKAQNINMIAPHLRPMYMIQQRPRKIMMSLAEIAQNPDGHIGPHPTAVPDIFSLFNVRGDSTPTRQGGQGGPGGYNNYNQGGEYDDFYGD